MKSEGAEKPVTLSENVTVTGMLSLLTSVGETGVELDKVTVGVTVSAIPLIEREAVWPPETPLL